MKKRLFLILGMCFFLACGDSPNSPKNLAGFFDIETVTFRQSNTIITTIGTGGLELSANGEYEINTFVSTENFNFRDIGSYTTSGSNITFHTIANGLTGTYPILENGTKIKVDAELVNSQNVVIGTVEIIYVKQ